MDPHGHPTGLPRGAARTVGTDASHAHPGGPFFARKDAGAWSIPKGEIEEGEDPLSVALREFAEETGQAVESCVTGDRVLPLGSVTQRGGKRVTAWAMEGDWPDGAVLTSNTFEIDWPPRPGPATTESARGVVRAWP